MSEVASWWEVQVHRSPSDEVWRTLYKDTKENVKEFWEVNQQLARVPDRDKRIVKIKKTIEIEVMT